MWFTYVAAAEFFRIKVPRVTEVPAFALRKVSGFDVHFAKGVPDTHLDQADQTTLG